MFAVPLIAYIMVEWTLMAVLLSFASAVFCMVLIPILFWLETFSSYRYFLECVWTLGDRIFACGSSLTGPAIEACDDTRDATEASADGSNDNIPTTSTTHDMQLVVYKPRFMLSRATSCDYSAITVVTMHLPAIVACYRAGTATVASLRFTLAPFVNEEDELLIGDKISDDEVATDAGNACKAIVVRDPTRWALVPHSRGEADAGDSDCKDIVVRDYSRWTLVSFFRDEDISDAGDCVCTDIVVRDSSNWTVASYRPLSWPTVPVLSPAKLPAKTSATIITLDQYFQSPNLTLPMTEVHRMLPPPSYADRAAGQLGSTATASNDMSCKAIVLRNDTATCTPWQTLTPSSIDNAVAGHNKVFSTTSSKAACGVLLLADLYAFGAMTITPSMTYMLFINLPFSCKAAIHLLPLHIATTTTSTMLKTCTSLAMVADDVKDKQYDYSSSSDNTA